MKCMGRINVGLQTAVKKFWSASRFYRVELTNVLFNCGKEDNHKLSGLTQKQMYKHAR
jgi:hypothetical protein